MKKMYIVGAAVALVLLAAGAVVYGPGLLKPGSGSPVGTAAPAQAEDTGADMITALQAMKIADNDAGVAGWKSGKSDAGVVRVSADSCTDGESPIWTVTYASGNEEASARIIGETVRSLNDTMLANGTQDSKIDATGIIDSNNASNIAKGQMARDGKVLSGSGTIELWAGAQGPVYEVTYPFEGGYYVFRIDALKGEIIKGAVFNAG